MRIVVLDAYTVDPGDNPLSGLAECGELSVYERTRDEEFLVRAQSADIILTNKTPMSADRIQLLPNLKFIGVLATGCDIVDVAAARGRGIPVAHVPAYGTDSVAQHTFALILELCNQVGKHAHSVADGDWVAAPDWSYWKAPIVEIKDLTLGVVGYGRIGRRVAELGAWFGMKILYSARQPHQHDAIPSEHASIESLFSHADIVTLHCRLTPETRHFVNRDLIATMKASAFLVNTARGALINEVDLAWALENGRLAGAALDVLSQEPPPADHPLLAAPHCLITPHMAWSSLTARRRIVETTIANVRAFQQGQLINIVN
jgi:glycerate dehydrogenase